MADVSQRLNTLARDEIPPVLHPRDGAARRPA
jgi:hypothetical protein